MHKQLIVGTLLLGAVLVAGCSASKHGGSKRLPGTFQLTPVTIDGSNTDWPSPYPDYDTKALLGYAIANDSKNLYITVETGDPATQLKILREGLTVWIDKTGGKEQVTAINYPLPNHATKKSSESEDRPAPMQVQQGRGGTGGNQRLAVEDRVRALLAGANEYSLQGFKGCNLQFPLLEQDTCGITVRMNMDMDGELVWEAVIPFKSFYYKQEIEKRDNGKPMSICIETTAAKRPAGQSPQGGGRRGGSGGFRPSIGFGGFGGMGMSMGGGRGYSNSSTQQDNIMEPMYKSSSTWKVFGLAHP